MNSPTSHKYLNDLASKAGLTCFINSLLREYRGWSVGIWQEKEAVLIDLAPDVQAVLPLSHHSQLGLFQYQGEYVLKKGKVLRALSALELMDQILRYAPWSKPLAERDREELLARIENSNRIMFLALREQQETCGNLEMKPENFVQGEQSLWMGHNFHPAPKSREGWEDHELALYSPELNGKFALLWLEVHPSILVRKTSKSFSDHEWLVHMLASEGASGETILEKRDPNFSLLPFHPWQWQAIKKQVDIASYVDDGLIREIGETDSPWFPTSSVRTLYNPKHKYMLKYSLNIMLTNSVRKLYEHEVDRGLQVDDVLQSDVGKKWLSEYPAASVMGEPCYLAIKDHNGDLIPDTILSVRYNPFSEGSDERCFVLGALTQADSDEKGSLLKRMIDRLSKSRSLTLQSAAQEWFAHYLDVVVQPLLMAQADFGILMGAHQQNIVVKIDPTGIPEKLYFRDCQGTGYSKLGYDLLSPTIKSLDIENGNILQNNEGNILLSYYLMINASFAVINRLGVDCGLGEEPLIQQLRDYLLELRERGVQDSSCLDYLIDSAELLNKGNFICTVEQFNENTLENPLAIYQAIPNPIYQLGVQK
ncbi:IucA/IucC family protein [Pseudobacteriovorax antillogorgiicola]|uniref:N2-citryl-N6-acetyl-N6-hydroxylysine synthase n=1 Tax=Pseudobacteriovorax antillogorgiicola TaxID=1513793 RepID=A0A1Y6CPM4_9BACT|nr:IucA/IucC family protein [Pseudobacteriovorax antillogorgiicola]TCS43615.1 N2-citryl-N6-acetyl-N6-hydroxylysine synthase [Pseudobacteriovorax antillogorgiicola]SMF80055.1 N2-citryl-N6-acetyl-N6-hydroxylysine synthase [Pseudobacteriovorax antillogorgiicola]